ncbi:MAG TPA: hypothetical protein DD850_04225 [Erwinia persicina]|uniref:Uncharacterized protein n=2 Tax=Erwinia persicina TaxID=55211 RepID=A0A3S7S891_9GAMM|nr:hypothetical protein CI789_17970 [Erwinia persicina]TKJ87583.1 hypothetical protein EpCFBP13511_16370 [Erwinia persicina]HBH66610.1 hypothetical protein [Erwinia persicina]HBH67361.1 hypothetical protein [Erwinia persicina]HBI06681.1 hypothetical protein [Erwinia persicina]
MSEKTQLRLGFFMPAIQGTVACLSTLPPSLTPSYAIFTPCHRLAGELYRQLTQRYQDRRQAEPVRVKGGG